MTFNPTPKNPYKKRKPTRKQRGAFSTKTRQEILDRDDGLCRVCKGVASQIHHVKFKSGGGRGIFTNGLSCCQKCHAEIHNSGNKTKFWQGVFAEMYGLDYYKDDWD